ncbi:EF-hand domain-containing protein [Mesorhizobium sp. J428]|uniref:EF-hand domain-containing protein n=1 Tax=Mesorhizobium sp. J428 TaxID=2898440 RepID=UPI00215122C2|nr:EF-hand domain-containing protein [Mesorhizobium sp. J428]MCR5858937.1 EF-hand domain-containing protein [Mesorhizobium sp. J428]
MKKSVLAWTFVAFAGAIGATASQAVAQDEARFERLDADKSGDISFEEFVTVVKDRLEKADSDGDGKLTVEEISTTFQGPQAKDQAATLVKHFDADKDGTVTLTEVEERRKQRFAKLDTNSDGKLVREEMSSGAAAPARSTGKGDRLKASAD